MSFTLLQLVATIYAFVQFAFADEVGTVLFPNTSFFEIEHYYPSPRYHVYPRRTDFSVASFVNWGQITDYNSKANDGDDYFSLETGPFAYCAIGNYSFWLSQYGRGSLAGAGAHFLMAMNGSHPSWAKIHPDLDDIDEDYNTMIPYTDDENDAMNEPYYFTFFAPRSSCVMTSATTAVQVWEILHEKRDDLAIGSMLVNYTINPDEGTFASTRPQDVYSSYYVDDDDDADYQYGYGLLSTMKVNGVIYMYAVDRSSYGNYQDVLLASAPASTVLDKSTWSYWQNSTQSWNTTEPLATKRRQDDAVYTASSSIGYQIDGGSMGSIFYSEYHHAYIFTYSTSDDPSTLIIEYAPTPAGPWSQNEQVLVNSTDVDFNYAIVTPYFYNSPAHEGHVGKELLISVSPASYDNTYWAYKLSFE
ncbi:hypothetical protein BZA70DRAFT_290580 [Myxozyma melibiosi]|uniref:DUF4185 domain-containing protein n=1 Tax=Myxozyma melibiosi TaxID=54550 RepID=A0ABR1F2F5_9ASCO